MSETTEPTESAARGARHARGLERLGEAGGRMEDLEAIFLTHLHADHANDLPALVKAAYFTPRSRRLDIVGPGGNAAMPGTRRWLATLVGPEGYR